MTAPTDTNTAPRSKESTGAAPDVEASADAASEKRQDRSARIAVTVFPLIMFGAFLAAFFSPSTFVPLAGYMTPLLAVTMLGMGMTLSIPDFTMIARHPKPVILGVLSQYAIMPLVGWSVANLLPLPPELKVGIILIGCVPGGTTSNVVSYLAKGNTALSVSMTAFSTMLAPIVTPLLTLWLAGTYMQVPAGSMALSIVQIVLLPVGAGLACNVFFHRQVARIQPAMPWVSVVAIAGWWRPWPPRVSRSSPPRGRSCSPQSPWRMQPATPWATPWREPSASRGPTAARSVSRWACRTPGSVQRSPCST